jgi:hypothetical protein
MSAMHVMLPSGDAVWFVIENGSRAIRFASAHVPEFANNLPLLYTHPCMNKMPAALFTVLVLCTTVGCGRKPTSSASKEPHSSEVVTNSPEVIKKYKDSFSGTTFDVAVVSAERVKYWKAPILMAIALEASGDEIVLVVSFRISSPTSQGGFYGLKLVDVSGHVYESTTVGGSFTAIKEKLSEPYTSTSSVGFKIPSNTDIRSFLSW